MKRPHRIIRTRGQRIAWTNTSRIPDSQVLDAIKFVASEVDLDRTIVHFKRHGRDRLTLGMAYKGLPDITNTDGLRRHEWRYLVVVTDHYGYGPLAGRDVIDLDTSIMHTLAHEAKHIEQFRERTPQSERACNRFGDWVVERWLATA